MSEATNLERPRLSPPRPKRFITVDEAMKRLGCQSTRAYRWIHEGRLLAVKAGKNTLVLESSLDDLLESFPPAPFFGVPKPSDLPKPAAALAPASTRPKLPRPRD